MSFTGYLVIAALGLGGIVALVVGFSWLFARHYCQPGRHLPTKTPADYDLPYAPVGFTSQGALLKGWFIPVDSDPATSPPLYVTTRPTFWLGAGRTDPPAATLPLPLFQSVLQYRRTREPQASYLPDKSVARRIIEAMEGGGR